MAKKSKKVEKHTRKLMESINDLVKKKSDRYKFKQKKKKVIKEVKKTCVHWIYRKGQEASTVIQDPHNKGYWICTLCGARFPIAPLPVPNPNPNDPDARPSRYYDPYYDRIDSVLEIVNQMQFYSVRMGGDADDTKMFLALRKNLPRFKKVSKQILKRVNQRHKYEDKREKGDSFAQLDAFSGVQFR